MNNVFGNSSKANCGSILNSVVIALVDVVN